MFYMNRCYFTSVLSVEFYFYVISLRNVELSVKIKLLRERWILRIKLIFYCGWKTLDVIQDMQMNDKRRFKRWKSNFLPNGTKCSKTLDNLVNEKREKRAIKMILFRTCTKRTVRKCWEFSLNHRFMVYRFIIYILVERAAAAKLTVGRHYRTSKEGCCSLSANYYTWRVTVTMARLSRDYNA